MTITTITTRKVTSLKDTLTLALLMFFSAVMSFAFFQKQSLRLDESQSLWQTSHNPLYILHLISQDVHVPLYHLILHAWQSFFGNDVSVTRCMSLLFFLLSIPAIYMLGELCYGRKVGLFTAVLFAISPFMNWYGNEIRMYSMFVLLAILHQYFFIKLFKRVEESVTLSWILFTIISVLGVYTHYFFYLILLSDTLFYLMNRAIFPHEMKGKFIKTLIVVALSFLPWILYVFFFGSIGNSSPMLGAPTTVSLFNTLSQFLFGFQTDHLNTILVSMWPITVLLVFLALRKNRRVGPETIFLIAGFVVPNVAAFLFSLLVSPIYLTRYLIFTLPMLYLLLSWIVSSYPRTLSTIVKVIIIVAMLGSLSIEAVSASTPSREDYRQAVEYLEKNASASDVIVVSAPFTIYPILYYYKGASSIETLPMWDRTANGPIPPFSEEELPQQIEKIKGTHQNLWLLLSYDQGYQEKVRVYFDTHFERLQVIPFSTGLTLQEYKLRYE